MPARFAPRALFFDMDGLLVDSEPLWFEVERAFAAARGAPWTHAMSLACVGRGTPFTLRRMSEMFGFPVDVARDEQEVFDRFIASVASLTLKPGAAEILAESAPRLPIALASSSPRRLIDAVLARFDLDRAFRVVVSGQDVERVKPAPDIFLRAARELAVDPASCAVLEDSIAGATAGRAAASFVIAVPEGPAEGRGFEAVADAIVADLFSARALLDLEGVTRGARPPAP